MQNIVKFGLNICENIQLIVILSTRFIFLSAVGIQLSKLIMANNIISNYSNILLDNVEYDEQINISLIKPSIETPVVTKPSSNHPEIVLNKNSSFENIENYIDEKYNEAAMSHLKQQILKDVEIAIKNSINNNTKTDIGSCLQSHTDTLLSETNFLREEIKEKNQLIKAVFRNEDVMPRVAQNTFIQ